MRNLYSLHLIDAELVKLRNRAAALDHGKAAVQAIKDFTPEFDEADSAAKSLDQELRDRELQEKSFTEKLASLEAHLYDGSLHSPKEIENAKSQIEMNRRLSSENDDRLFALFELAPPAVERASELNIKMEQLKVELERHKQAALRLHQEIKQEFDALKAKRPDATAGCDDDLLSTYEAIRKRNGGIAMATTTDDSACSACGVNISQKSLERVFTDQLTTCEQCQLIIVAPQMFDEEE